MGDLRKYSHRTLYISENFLHVNLFAPMFNFPYKAEIILTAGSH